MNLAKNVDKYIASAPKEAQSKLRFQTALEPDGNGSHWFRINKSMREAIGALEQTQATL